MYIYEYICIHLCICECILTCIYIFSQVHTDGDFEAAHHNIKRGDVIGLVGYPGFLYIYIHAIYIYIHTTYVQTYAYIHICTKQILTHAFTHAHIHTSVHHNIKRGVVIGRVGYPGLLYVYIYLYIYTYMYMYTYIYMYLNDIRIRV